MAVKTNDNNSPNGTKTVRKGVHAKSKTSLNKNSKNYKKLYAKQGK